MAAPDPQPEPREELLALADELLRQATQIREQWDVLHRALRGDAAADDVSEQRRRALQERTRDADPRRLVAVEMMLAGRSRADVERHLRREFGDAAAEEVLAEVYAEGA